MELKARRHKAEDTASAIEMCYENGWTDGLPVIPPTADLVEKMLEAAKLAARKAGLTVFGGVNAPYIWVNVGRDSWEFFDLLLSKANVVGTPGSGFGAAGEGYFRLSAFNSLANVQEALQRIRGVL